MMKAFTTGSAILFAAAFAGMALAQGMGGPPPGASGQPVGNHMGPNNMTQEQFDRNMEQADLNRRLSKDDKAKGKTIADLLAEDKAAVTQMVKDMPLSCDVTDAEMVAQGDVPGEDGKPVTTQTYEAACANGLGYFIVKPGAGKAYGFSCFAADASAQADIAAGKKPSPTCKLKANADMKAMGAAVLTRGGKLCTAVTNYRWVGQNSTQHTEFDEFACDGGNGYMVVSALPGAAFAPQISTCPESAKRNLPCKYSDNGAPLVTLQTMREALTQRNITCDATDQTTRVLGQENAKKRYVVEFACTGRPRGLVAYIPLTGATAPFEAIDCDAAKKRGVTCTLTK